MKIARIGLFTCAMTLPIAALARIPYTPRGTDDALVRLSWRMNVSARDSCRPRTQAELDALAVHMRTPEVCTPTVATYVLITTIDQGPADTFHLVRRGIKGDRPLFVLQERRLAPGAHDVGVAIERTTSSGTEVLAAFDTVLTLNAGRVQLITLDAQGRLTARSTP